MLVIVKKVLTLQRIWEDKLFRQLKMEKHPAGKEHLSHL